MRSDLIRVIPPKMLLIATLFACCVCPAVHAVIINFDDIEHVVPEDECYCFYVHPLTDEYAAQGLMIEGGYLWPYEEEYPEWDDIVVSRPNFLIAGTTMNLRFIERLPSVVSLRLSPFFDAAVIIDIYGAEGWLRQVITDGYAGSLDDPGAQRKQLLSFTAPEGISLISFRGYYNSRVSGAIDDITYSYAVDEPSPWLPMLFGLTGIILLRGRKMLVLSRDKTLLA